MQKVSIEFDEGRHEYRIDGKLYPSVTTILSSVGLPDLSMVPKDVLEWKADLGTKVHFATQLEDENDLDEDSIDLNIKPYLEAYRRFKTDFDFKVMEIELQTYHPAYQYVGTFDRFGYGPRGEFWLIDFKTGTCDPLSVGPQTAAYVEGFKEYNCTEYKKININRAALKLNNDGTYKFKKLTNKMDFQIFLNALNIYNWRCKK